MTVNDSAQALGAAVALGTSQAQPELIQPDGAEVAAVYTVPDDYSVVPVDLERLRAPYRARPVRKTGTVKVDDVQALLAYHAKHATPSAEIWVGHDGTIVDVLNAHGSASAEWQDHRAVLSLKTAPEWLRWQGISGRLLPQAEFAEFLEGAAVDVIDPDMATMLEVAQSLEATTKVEWKSAYRTADGQRAFRYEETVNAKAGQKGELEIPPSLTLSLRVYEGQVRDTVMARFRYRIQGDQLLLGVVIDRTPELVEQARLSVAEEIANSIELGIVLAGSPS